MAIASSWIVLAQILRPQGRKGEVLADLFTDFPERFADRPDVWLAPHGFAEQPAGSAAASARPAAPVAARIAAHWLPMGKNSGRIVLHFAGVDSIEQAQQLTGSEVILPIAERLPLDEGAAYVSDLVGATVYDGDTALGVVESVQFPSSPDGARRLEDAAPLLAITSPEGDEILVPYAAAFLVALDLPGRSIRMALPEGLADINRTSTVPDE